MMRSYLLSFILLFGCVVPMHAIPEKKDWWALCGILAYPVAFAGVMTTSYAIGMPRALLQGHSVEKSIERATGLGLIGSLMGFIPFSIVILGQRYESEDEFLKSCFLYGALGAGMISAIDMLSDTSLVDCHIDL